MTFRPTTHRASPLLYASVFAIWGLTIALASETLFDVLAEASVGASALIAAVFIGWLALMWLVGIWHLANVLFSWVATRVDSSKVVTVRQGAGQTPPAAILYTTCNDFDPVAFKTCLRQSYENYEVIVCDDSDRPERVRREVDIALQASGQHPPVTIVRRGDRKGFKAGNMNNALRIHGDRFEYFAVADADEMLPEEFLTACTSRMSDQSDVAFVQCAHAARPAETSAFENEHGIAIAGHWRHFVPARERFGLLLFYGHGAVIRTAAWREVGGFPEIVSEDLALTVALRRAGYRGVYAADVVCEESFPPDFSSLTRRTGKWVRGTLEFFRTHGVSLLASPQISTTEKLDALFCAVSLLLPLPFIAVMLMIAGLYLSGGSGPAQIALTSMWDNPFILAAGLTAMLSPMAYTLAELPRRGLRVVRQLIRSSATYLAVAPHAAWEELGYLLTGRASFPITGSGAQAAEKRANACHVVLLAVGGVLFIASLAAADFLLLGVATAFLMGQLTLRRGRSPGLLACAPFFLIVIGIVLMPISLLAAPLAVGAAFTAHQ